MGLPVAQTNGRQLSDWVPESILQSLISSKRSSARVRLSPSRANQASPTGQQRAAGQIAPSAVQEEHKLFLADAANLPESLHDTAGPSEGEVEAEMQRMARAVASNQSNPSSKHTYGSTTGKPQLPSSKPPQREKLDNPVRSVRDQRERILGRLAKSKSLSSSGITASVYEKNADYRRGGAQESLDLIFDPNIHVPPEKDGKHGTSSPARQRKRPPVPVSSMPIYPHPLNISTHAHAITPNGDAIDEFLVNSNRNATFPIASGQRMVSDHRNNLAPGFINEISSSQVGSISSQGVYVPGVEASSAEERIGQFGGLIPTLYTMDSPPAQRRITLAPNRYNFQVISRETKVTGAGFRRYTSTSPLRSHKAQSRRASPIPNESSEQHQIAQDQQVPTN